MQYEINVAINRGTGFKHYFATADRSLRCASEKEVLEMAEEFKTFYSAKYGKENVKVSAQLITTTHRTLLED